MILLFQRKPVYQNKIGADGKIEIVTAVNMKSILEQWKKKYREDSRPNCSGSC
jgi:hypothetical protein